MLRIKACVEARDGEIVGAPYSVGPRLYVRVRCALGHEWEPAVGKLVSGQWCAECAGNVPLGLEEMQKLAIQRQGKCLSVEYTNNKTKLDWECSIGHRWSARPFNIKVLGQWCPVCKTHVGEEIVRATLEEAFPGHAFPRTRTVEWMGGLELDGYCEELKIAFEHQGVQHFKDSPFFHRKAGSLEAQQARDARKQDSCTENFVTLLITTYTTPNGELRNFVRRELYLLGYELAHPETLPTDAEFLDTVRAKGDPSRLRQYAKMCAIIEQKGGFCLSTSYLSFDTPVRIRCGRGHEFEATPRAFCQADSRGPRFCPDCSTHRHSDAALKAELAKYGYTFIRTGLQQSGARQVRTIQAKCPVDDHPVFTKLLSNLKLPRHGCPKCGHARCGRPTIEM